MVDLKANQKGPNQLMRQFNPADPGSYSQKKREKRKRKNEKDEVIKLAEEKKQMEKAYAKARKESGKSRKPGHFDRVQVTQSGDIV